MKLQTALSVSALVILLSLPACAQDFKTLLLEGDKFAEVTFENQKALDKYKKAEALEPSNYSVLWRLSRAYVDIAEHLPASTDKQKDEQLAMYQKSASYAEKAVKVNPGGMMGYLRRAIANGRIALFKGVFSVIGMVKDVKADVEKSIRLNNETPYQLALAHYLMGRTHAKVCEKAYLVRLPLGLGWGDREIAAREYERAISMDPTFIMFRLDAARNYIEMDEFQKARDHLTKIGQLAIRDEDDKTFKRDATALIAEIKDE